MYNHYKHGNLNDKTKAILRNERPINNDSNKNTEPLKSIEHKKFNELKRLSMRMMSDSTQVNSDDTEVLSNLFNFYKTQILELSTEIESEDKAFAPIQEIMQNEHFLTEKPIQNRLEYRERLGKLIDIIEQYVD